MSTKKKERVKALLQDGFLELKDYQNKRLDEIEKFVQDKIKEINERSKAIQGFIVREVQYKIANQLYNMEITQEAFINIIANHGVKIENLNELIDAEKKDVHQRREKEAEARMKENLTGEQEAKPEETKEQKSE